MSRKAKNRRPGGRSSLILKILAVFAVTLLLVCTAAFSALAIFALRSRGAVSDRFRATAAERFGSAARIFYSRSEIDDALSYLPPREAEEIAPSYPSAAVSVGPGPMSGDGWNGIAVVLSKAETRPLLTPNSEGSSGSPASVGLDGYSDIIFEEGCVRYAGEGGEALYCVVACDPSGDLHIGGKTVVEIANSGYEWAVSASRVLIAGGIPQTGLGGGYAPRAAVGQTAEGDYVLFCAASDGFYPCGITYDELASVMFSLGCVNAAALEPRQSMKTDGQTAVSLPGTAGRSLVFAGKEAGVD